MAMGTAQSARDAELAFLALLLRRPAGEGRPERPSDSREQESFYRAVSKFYRIGRDQLREVAAGAASLEELATLCHLARHAGLEAAEIVRLRGAGLSWTGLVSLLHLSRESFYVPLGRSRLAAPGASYRKEARQAWATADLTDPDIVNLVNLKFLCEYYGCPPEHVIALRSMGWSFAAMHSLFRQARADQPRQTRARKKRRSQR
jgi:hypothetical protein